jgi:uncharacterized membrane protein YhfC
MTAAAAFLTGAISVACFVIALFFVRFWHSTRDRFFIFLALSFTLEGLTRGASVALQSSDTNPVFYGTRVIAYGLIIVAIWQKNRSR